MKRIVVAVALVGGLVIGQASIADAGRTRTIKVGDNWFYKSGKPRSLSVDSGTKLRFKWVGSGLHNVYLTKAPKGVKKKRSETMRSGTYSRRVSKRGRYVFICEVHYPNDPQKVTIKVE